MTRAQEILAEIREWVENLHKNKDTLEIMLRDHQDVDMTNPDHRDKLAEAIRKHLGL